MEFNKNQPIYLQIADLLCERIILKEWLKGDRIPSVRDLASEIQVNPNTVMRTYSFLQEQGIINNQRGIGFFITENGYNTAKKLATDKLFKDEMIGLFRKMRMLGITIEDLFQFYNNEIKKQGEQGNEKNN